MVIFLIGFMGCGKSYWAKHLAEHLNYIFIDSDNEISKNESQSIQEIFSSKGENYFRQLEKKWLDNFDSTNSVVAIGGGLPIFNNNIEQLLNKGKVFWVDEPFEVIYERIKMDKNRPLLSKSKDDLEKLYKERLSVYSKGIKISSPKSIEDFLFYFPNTKS